MIAADEQQQQQELQQQILLQHCWLIWTQQFNLQDLQVLAAFQNWTIVEKNNVYKQLGLNLHVLVMNEDGIHAPGFPPTKTFSNDLKQFNN